MPELRQLGEAQARHSARQARQRGRDGGMRRREAGEVGIGERQGHDVARRLNSIEAEVLTLHGGQDAARQDAVLGGSRGGRRVVLATAIAETSLTVPGVRVVVDELRIARPRSNG